MLKVYILRNDVCTAITRRSQPASFISGMGAQNIRVKLIEAVTIAQAFDLYICHLEDWLSRSYLFIVSLALEDVLPIRKIVSYHNVLS